MIYKNLDTIPYKLFVKIAETGDVSLLSTNLEKDNIDNESLIAIWEEMFEEHNSRNQTSDNKRKFKLSKMIDGLFTSNKVILMSCQCLRFSFEIELIEILKSYDIDIDTSNTNSYYQDIEKAERKANDLIVKAEYHKSILNKDNNEDSNQSKKDYSSSSQNIDDIMAMYSTILGLNIGDFNKITYTAYHGFERQVNSKIKAYEEHLNKR